MLVFLCGLACPLFAQDRHDLRQFKDEAFLFVKQPGKWGGRDWLKLGLVGAGTYEVHQYDAAIKRAASKRPGNAKNFFVELGGQWGGYFVVPLGGLGLVAHGWTTGNPATEKLGFEVIQAAVYAQLVSGVLKTATGRARPGTHGADSGTYRPFSLYKSAYNSFPAGHVEVAFALSTVLSRSAESPYLKVLAYVPAGLTAAERIYSNEHWASDCFMGAAIGYFTADWVMDLHQKNSGESGASGLELRPFSAGGPPGLELVFKF